jgi:DNA helicase-2/ATP-dependent DNA helicase PcrA
MFQENEDVLAEYQRWFRYMLVDEYQDTNVAQYLWLRLLAQGTATSAASATTTSRSMAGAARRWTTSCASRRIFPAPGVIRLERNYRSTAYPRCRLRHLIAHNEGRLGKTLFTDPTPARRSGARPLGRRRGSPRHRRGDRAGSQGAGTSLDDMAILVRASFQMRAFEDRFVTLGLPYRVIGGPRFYERGNPRCDGLSPVTMPARQRSRLRAHRQCAQARHGVTVPCRRCAPCPRRRHPLYRAAARHRRHRRASRQGAQVAD